MMLSGHKVVEKNVGKEKPEKTKKKKTKKKKKRSVDQQIRQNESGRKKKKVQTVRGRM